MRTTLIQLIVAIALGTATPSLALEWPDVAERVERDLSSDDASVRLAAVRKLASLGATRGAPLALLALDDSDDEVRLAAADAAVRLHAPGTSNQVASWVGSPSPRLRRKACEVAGAMPSASAIGTLARALGDSEADVREAAAHALGRQASREAVAPLLGRLDDPSPSVRIAIARSLAALHDARAVVPLVDRIADSSAEVRQVVARALGELGDGRASARLVTALRDPSQDVRREALTAIGLLHAGEAVDAVVAFIGDRSPPIRAAALHALATIETPEAIGQLVNALGGTDENAAGLESTALRDALVSVGTVAIPLLRECLKAAKSPAAAEGAAWVLGALAAHEEAPTIVAAMRNGTISPAFAMHALAGAGTPAEAPVVLEYILDPSAVVRDQALGAAMALLDPHHPDGRAVEPLGAAFNSGRLSAQERSRVALLLGRTGAARAARILEPIVHADDRVLRLAAIDALGALGPANADQQLLELLDATDARTRLHAAIALAESGGATARASLLEKLSADTEIDRAALLTALGGILARLPSDSDIERLAPLFWLSVGAERDALLEAIGRAPTPAAVSALDRVAQSVDSFDRRAVASMLGAHAHDARALAIARRLIDDSDPSVQSQAAWSLGIIGDVADVQRLLALAGTGDVELAADAVAAVGRIAARSKRSDVAASLCPMLTDKAPFVRINALSGVAMSAARCPPVDRTLLAEDPDEEVRLAAARAIAVQTSADDVRALDRCAESDPSPQVASQCHDRAWTAPKDERAVLVYVTPEGWNVPKADAFFAAIWADGMVRLGRADRRGAFFEAAAPKGVVRLVNASEGRGP